MSETPEEWLGRLFEFETCAECGGDAEDHEVCLVPGMGTYFARCLRADAGDVADDDTSTTVGDASGDPRRWVDRAERHHPKGRGQPGPFGDRP
jgi:hypothetical protein